MTASELKELRELFAGMHDGTLPEAGLARLEKLLAENPEARQMWFLHCDMETGLADWAAARGARSMALHLPQDRTSTPGARWGWAGSLAAAAALLVGAFLWWLGHSPVAPMSTETPSSGVARLAAAVGVEWADGIERTPGAILAPGTLKLKKGAALVEFYSGARVVVEGPAEFRLVGSGEVFLHSGKINAHVPPQARGFTVNSVDARVVDLGTDFGFVVGGSAPAEVHVFTGKVEVSVASKPARAVNEGEAVRVEAATLAPIPPSRPAFLTEEELSRKEQAEAYLRFKAWQAASEGMSRDPAAVVHYTFSDADVAERRLSNRSGAAPVDSHGSIVGGSWVEGRWPGKRALEFRGEGDRVRILAPPAIPSVTLLAWVRVDALPRWQNVLLSTDSGQPGALRWHITQPGELRLEIARDLGRPGVDWEAVNSAPFLTADRLGRWVLLVTTFDGKTIRHYGNGELIGSGASFTPPALHIATAELANWRGATQRHLAGAMDEFAIFSRALSGDEIRALYRSGR